MLVQIPNILTLLRIALIPVLVVLYFLDFPLRNEFVVGTFILAAFTDWLDGFLARKLNAASALGAFLDPVADKLIVSTALVLLATDGHVLETVWHYVPFTIAICIIIGREIVISSLREWMAELGERGIVAVGMLGKLKTTLQMVAIIFMLYAKDLYSMPILKTGEILLYVAAALTIWSMWVYLRAAMPYLLKK